MSKGSEQREGGERAAARKKRAGKKTLVPPPGCLQVSLRHLLSTLDNSPEVRRPCSSHGVVPPRLSQLVRHQLGEMPLERWKRQAPSCLGPHGSSPLAPNPTDKLSDVAWRRGAPCQATWQARSCPPVLTVPVPLPTCAAQEYPLVHWLLAAARVQLELQVCFVVRTRCYCGGMRLWTPFRHSFCVVHVAGA